MWSWVKVIGAKNIKRHNSKKKLSIHDDRSGQLLTNTSSGNVGQIQLLDVSTLDMDGSVHSNDFQSQQEISVDVKGQNQEDVCSIDDGRYRLHQVRLLYPQT